MSEQNHLSSNHVAEKSFDELLNEAIEALESAAADGEAGKIERFEWGLRRAVEKLMRLRNAAKSTGETSAVSSNTGEGK